MLAILNDIPRWAEYVLEGLFKAWTVMWDSDGSTLFFAGALVGAFFLFVLTIMREREPPRRAYRRGLVQFSSSEFQLPSPRPLMPFPGGSSQAVASSGNSVRADRVVRALMPPRGAHSRRLAPTERLAPTKGVAPTGQSRTRGSVWRSVWRSWRPQIQLRVRRPQPSGKGSEPGKPAKEPKKGPGRARRIFDTLVPPPDKKGKRKKKRRGKEVVVLNEGVSGRQYVDLEDVR